MALPDPVTRKEMYLNKAATGSGSVPPEPVTREEMYLAEIANGGGSGGGDQEPLVINLLPSDVEDITKGGTYTGATPSEVREHLLSGGQVVAKFYGLCFQLTGAVFDENNGNASGLHVEDQDGAGIVLVINVHCGPYDSATYELHTYLLNPMQ